MIQESSFPHEIFPHYRKTLAYFSLPYLACNPSITRYKYLYLYSSYTVAPLHQQPQARLYKMPHFHYYCSTSCYTWTYDLQKAIYAQISNYFIYDLFYHLKTVANKTRCRCFNKSKQATQIIHTTVGI